MYALIVVFLNLILLYLKTLYNYMAVPDICYNEIVIGTSLTCLKRKFIKKDKAKTAVRIILKLVIFT